MATKITDFAANARIYQAVGPLETAETTLTTEAIDCIDGDGPGFAIISIGPEQPDAVVSGTVESSADGEDWDAVPNGEIAEMTGSGVQAITFQRPGRYLRVALDLENDSEPLTLAVLLGQSRKLM